MAASKDVEWILDAFLKPSHRQVQHQPTSPPSICLINGGSLLECNAGLRLFTQLLGCAIGKLGSGTLDVVLATAEEDSDDVIRRACCVSRRPVPAVTLLRGGGPEDEFNELAIEREGITSTPPPSSAAKIIATGEERRGVVVIDVLKDRKLQWDENGTEALLEKLSLTLQPQTKSSKPLDSADDSADRFSVGGSDVIGAVNKGEKTDKKSGVASAKPVIVFVDSVTALLEDDDVASGRRSAMAQVSSLCRRLLQMSHNGKATIVLLLESAGLLRGGEMSLRFLEDLATSVVNLSVSELQTSYIAVGKSNSTLPATGAAGGSSNNSCSFCVSCELIRRSKGGKVVHEKRRYQLAGDTHHRRHGSSSAEDWAFTLWRPHDLPPSRKASTAASTSLTTNVVRTTGVILGLGSSGGGAATLKMAAREEEELMMKRQVVLPHVRRRMMMMESEVQGGGGGQGLAVDASVVVKGAAPVPQVGGSISVSSGGSGGGGGGGLTVFMDADDPGWEDEDDEEEDDDDLDI